MHFLSALISVKRGHVKVMALHGTVWMVKKKYHLNSEVGIVVVNDM